MLTKSFKYAPQPSLIFICHDCLRKQFPKRLERQVRWESRGPNAHSHFSSPKAFDFTQNFPEPRVDAKDREPKVGSEEGHPQKPAEKARSQKRRPGPTGSGRRKPRPLIVRKIVSEDKGPPESDRPASDAPNAPEKLKTSKTVPADGVDTPTKVKQTEVTERQRKARQATQHSKIAAIQVARYLGITNKQAQNFPKILQLVRGGSDGALKTPTFKVKDNLPEDLLKELGLDNEAIVSQNQKAHSTKASKSRKAIPQLPGLEELSPQTSGPWNPSRSIEIVRTAFETIVPAAGHTPAPEPKTADVVGTTGPARAKTPEPTPGTTQSKIQTIKPRSSRTASEQPSDSPASNVLQTRGRGADKTTSQIHQISAKELQLKPLEVPQPPVPTLAHDLQRVLFNPGVYQLQDPRSRVFNFDPYLENITPVADFNFKALKDYIVSSEDTLLRRLATEHKAKYYGSTSSMTSVLTHFHFLISQWRPLNVQNLSQGFTDPAKAFTAIGKAPSAVFLVYKDGAYAIDADKEYSSSSILMELGKSLEKFLTLPPEKYERYKKTDEFGISEEERKEPESYHYTKLGDFMMRSQLDAYDPRLPGTGMFDLKTRAVISIRMNPRDHDSGMGYQISHRYGEWSSYEREYFDMIRSPLLKYSLQVRMGRMDGIFVAYHNVERIFGFQYVSLPEMDLALHDQTTPRIGDDEFKLSLKLWNEILDRATERFPRQTLRLHFETREAVVPFMYIFAEPVTEEEMETIQSKNQKEIEEMTRRIHSNRTIRERTEHMTSEGSSVPDKSEGSDQDSFVTGMPGTTTLERAVQSHTVTEMEAPDLEDWDSQSVSDSWEALKLNPITEVEHVTPGEIVSAQASEESNSETSDAALVDMESVEELEMNPLAAVEPDVHDFPSDMAPDTVLDLSDIEASDLASDPSTSDNLSSSTPALDSASTPTPNQDPSSSTNTKPLLGFSLVIRNLVNNRPVERPNSLSPSDTWDLEYNLTELKESQTHALYLACQRRRKKALDFSEDHERAAAIAQQRQENPDAVTDNYWSTNAFFRKIGEMVNLGRQKREREMKEDRERGERGESVKVLYSNGNGNRTGVRE